MQGWISLHRQILEWEWYKDNNVKSLFLHCLLKANHKSKKWKGITIERGQFITGRKQLADETGLSEQEVRTALKKLKRQELTIKATNKYSVVTVVNYEIYQDSKEESNQQPNQQSTNNQPTINQQSTTTNNDNNDNNDIKDNSCNSSSNTVAEIKFDEQSFEIQLVNYLIGKIKEELPNARTPDINDITDKQKWAIHVDRMKRLDKRTEQDIKRVLKFATTNSFWKTNILSTKKLRDKFDTLYAQSIKIIDDNNKPQSKFINYEQRTYDFDELERKAMELQTKD